MIKLEYRPWSPDSELDELFDVPAVKELTMILSDDITWDEATYQFHNFLRAAGYVIPYDFEEGGEDRSAFERNLCNEIDEGLDALKNSEDDDVCVSCQG
jgi:hypothetical protein